MRFKQALAFLFIFATILIPVAVFAQEKSDLMRDNGRIYVVVAVMVTILVGLLLYIIRLDRKIAKLEKELDHKP